MSISNDFAAQLRAAKEDADRLRQALVQADRDLETTRQQYVDADHAANLWHAECRRLRSEASELMAKEANQVLLIAGLRQRNDWHTQNAERQADVIRAQEAELEFIKRNVPVGAPWKWERPGQQDLPPTRAEEQERSNG